MSLRASPAALLVLFPTSARAGIVAADAGLGHCRLTGDQSAFHVADVPGLVGFYGSNEVDAMLIAELSDLCGALHRVDPHECRVFAGTDGQGVLLAQVGTPAARLFPASAPRLCGQAEIAAPIARRDSTQNRLRIGSATSAKRLQGVCWWWMPAPASGAARRWRDQASTFPGAKPLDCRFFVTALPRRQRNPPSLQVAVGHHDRPLPVLELRATICACLSGGLQRFSSWCLSQPAVVRPTVSLPIFQLGSQAMAGAPRAASWRYPARMPLGVKAG